MILEQLYLGCLSQASYVIGDPETGFAAVVDPRRDVDLYLDFAKKNGLRIERIFLTHFHADFASGHLELAQVTGAPIHLGPRATPEYPWEPVPDGTVLESGSVRIEIWETPGHTPESISLLVYDLHKSREHPDAVLTGDCLFVGDVGRPDLLVSVGISEDQLARELYKSTRRLMTLPDATRLMPGHGAGSLCGKSLSAETVSTIGQQRQFNPAVAEMTEAVFVERVTQGQPPAPAYFPHSARFNKVAHPTLSAVLEEIPTVDLATLLKHQAGGAVVVDTRSPDEFARGNLPGSLSLGLDGKYASWAGTVIDPGVPIVLIAPKGREQEAAIRLGRIGYDQIVGILQNPDRALSAAESLLTHDRISATTLARRIAGGTPVVDVREPGEWAQSHVSGSINLPLTQLAQSFDRLPNRPFVIHCQGGYRSCIAASLIQNAGRSDFEELRGGFREWIAGGNPVEAAQDCCG